jgi:hypothetical protein
VIVRRYAQSTHGRHETRLWSMKLPRHVVSFASPRTSRRSRQTKHVTMHARAGASPGFHHRLSTRRGSSSTRRAPALTLDVPPPPPPPPSPAPLRHATCLSSACSRTSTDSASAGPPLRLWDTVSERDTQFVAPRSTLTPRIPSTLLHGSTGYIRHHGFACSSPCRGRRLRIPTQGKHHQSAHAYRD